MVIQGKEIDYCTRFVFAVVEQSKGMVLHRETMKEDVVINSEIMWKIQVTLKWNHNVHLTGLLSYSIVQTDTYWGINRAALKLPTHYPSFCSITNNLFHPITFDYSNKNNLHICELAVAHYWAPIQPYKYYMDHWLIIFHSELFFLFPNRHTGVGS